MFEHRPHLSAQDVALVVSDAPADLAGDREFDDAAWVEFLRREPTWDTPEPDDLRVAPPLYGAWTPSGWSALELDTGTDDCAQLDDTTLIEAIVGFDRVASWAAARQARLLAELLRRRPADRAPTNARSACVGSDFAPDEVGVALHLSRGSAAARLGLADRLLRVLPATHALWESGQIDTPKARAVAESTVVLTDELARAVEARVLPTAPQQTLAQLTAALARAIIAADPDGAAERHREARTDRRVCVGEENDGMASLWALLSAPDAAGCYEWLTRLARGLGSEDPRGIDARRADLLVALLTGQLVAGAAMTPTDGPAAGTTGSTGTGPGPVIRPVTPGKPLVQVVMAHSTLVGADDQPADLVGHGPIPASLAREVAADGVWRLCRAHHTLKHHSRWRIEAHGDGRLTWITPTGHRHTTSPHDHRAEPPPVPAEPVTPTAWPPNTDSDPPPF